ncbi:arsenite methyltransferase [Colletotrichum spaethianum]|uniref:Arsenite methyltransferase n=1 Tax=Colletotrichum spaethianum TaxID=700344 RepID=A0AA37PER2_9PEZI|nr:arsenite methyltransferase [Colletotrichum spaethianum]GKT50936.1 arsenite methyltransferase [Colletotrichum spaethianum]
MDFDHETQAASSQRMYTARADNYENSFHPDYTKRFMAVADVQPGERVLILACGTGLEVLIAAEQMGDRGDIVGVDITDAMLAKAREKQERLKPRASIRLYNHDVTKLETLPELDGQAFDVILCSSAFVLFDDPDEVVKSWRKYLKPEGRLVVDITHENNLKIGLLLERAARRLGTRFPSNRSWITDRNSFTKILEGAGYAVERIELMDKLSGQGDTTYGMDQVDEQFDWITGTSLTIKLATEEFKRKTRALFREEWEKDAVDGEIVNVDAPRLAAALQLGLHRDLGMVALQGQPGDLLQLLDGLVRPPQMDLDRPETLLPCFLQVLTNVVEEHNVARLDALDPPQRLAPFGARVLGGVLVEHLESELVHPRVRLPQPDVRRRDEDVKQAAHGVVQEIPLPQPVALGEDDGVTQRREDILAALLELLQRGEHPRVRRDGVGHHGVEEVLPVDGGEGRDLLRQGRVLGPLGGVEGLPPSLVVEVRVEARKEGLVHRDRARLEAVPEARGTGLGDGVVDPSRRNAETELVVEYGLKRRDDLGKSEDN